MANRAVERTRLDRLALLMLVLSTAGCIVRGGEEETHQPEWSSVGIVRFEAVNQEGETVGSGCTVDRAEYRDQIRFRAAAGDKVELTQLFEAVITTPRQVDEHSDEPEYWCAQTDTERYVSVPDVGCWNALRPDDSDECFLESAQVGNIESVGFIPDSSEPVQSETDGFVLSIAVLDTGKQCVETQCSNNGLRGQQLAFVVE